MNVTRTPAPLGQRADAPVPLSLVARVLTVLISAYRRWLSPLLGPHCRFAPSCSSYALEAVRRHGAVRGSWLALRRLARCHPFHPGGVDPVPLRGGRHGHGGCGGGGDTAGDGAEIPSSSGEQRC